MVKYRDNLPQLSDKLFLTDGGLETTLLFVDGFDLPEFAAFTLLDNNKSRSALEGYFRDYTRFAVDNEVGFILESMTWRASSRWGDRIGYDAVALDQANRDAIELLACLRNEMETALSPIVISGCLGPRGDGYSITEKMSSDAAESYHRPQIESFAETEADMVAAFTMNYFEEAVGLARAAQAEGMPVVISFTVEVDGRLPSGQHLGDAINSVDAATGFAPAYYMINCAHPSHFVAQLNPDAPWIERLKGVRANASSKSHAELDEAVELDDGDPVQLGEHYRQLRTALPQINVLGGCCGTDLRHIKEIYKACMN